MKITKYNNYKNISVIKLKELRKNAKLSQQDLAEKLQLEGIDLTSKEISKIETNKRLVQDFELFAFAKIFKVSVSFLLQYNCSTL
jgi:transcriptional regulator with XRE-family HTH domain